MSGSAAGSPHPRRGLPLHRRTYEVEAFLEDEGHFRLVGRLRDVKPQGISAIPDDEPFTMHDMEVALLLAAPALVIEAIETNMHVHPQHECPLVLSAYQQVVGMSIARGFIPKVREMFGGPKACSHIGALLIAMAPVAMQSQYGFAEHAPLHPDPDYRAPIGLNRDTCHVWATGGPMDVRVAAGENTMPITMQARLRAHGIDPDNARG